MVKSKKMENSEISVLFRMLILLYFATHFCTTVNIFPQRALFMLGIPVISLFFVFLRNKVIRFDKISLLLIIMAVIVTINTLVVNKSFDFVKSDLMTLGFIILLMENICNNEKDLNKLLKIVFIVGFIGGSIIGIYQRFTGALLDPLINPYWQKSYGLVTATLSDTNYSALQLTSTLFIGLYLREQVVRKILYDIAIIITFIGIILTVSRTTILACIFSVCLSFFLEEKKSKIIKHNLIKFLVWPFFLLAAYSLIIIFSAQITESINDINNMLEFKSSGNFTTRVYQWKWAIYILFNLSTFNLFYGFGDNYKLILSSFSGEYMTLHNTFLEIFVQYGLLVFILLLLQYFLAFKYYLKIIRKHKKFIPLFCGFLAITMSQAMVSLITIDSYIFIAVAILVNRTHQNDTQIKY